MHTATKLIFLALFIGFASWVTQTEFKDVQQDDEIVYSESEPSTHDKYCGCDYCTEETPYYMEVMGNDSTLKLGQELTVISIDTMQGLTCITLK